MSESTVGRRIGQYELHEIIGKGGMAIVYRASQPRIERDVAIKIIAAPYARHPDFVRRFEQEMRATVRLQHPHILPVYDVSLEGSDLYMVMAYLPGGTLSRRIAAAPAGLPVADAVCIASQVASALDYAHAQGVIHRDVKPGNIMLDARGNAYLGDFGVAQVADAETTHPLGTFAYMAPELLSGGKATPASDVYSLGVVAFEMLAGVRPYEAHTRDALLALRDRVGIPDILELRPDLPPGLQVVLTQALAEDPSGRPPHASSLAAALHRASGLTGLPCAGLADFPVVPPEEEDEVFEDDLLPSNGDGAPAAAIPSLRLPLDDVEDEAFADLDDNLLSTPPPFADLSWAPGGLSTEPRTPVDQPMRQELPPTKVAVPAVAPRPRPGPEQRSAPRLPIGPLLLVIWLGVILILLGLAVLAVVLISRA